MKGCFGCSQQYEGSLSITEHRPTITTLPAWNSSWIPCKVDYFPLPHQTDQWQLMSSCFVPCHSADSKTDFIVLWIVVRDLLHCSSWLQQGSRVVLVSEFLREQVMWLPWRPESWLPTWAERRWWPLCCRGSRVPNAYCRLQTCCSSSWGLPWTAGDGPSASRVIWRKEHQS